MRPPPPILDRELRAASRRSSTFRLRFLAATAAALLGGIHLLASLLTGASSGQGHTLFSWLAHIAFACSLLAGPLLTADCLSRERREGTLGLLFLTDLSGLEVATGKIVALGLIPLHALLAVLPIAALAFFMGGVTASEFWRTAAAILNTTFLSLTTGLLVSSRGSDERQSIGWTLGILLALITGAEALARLPFPTAELLRLASPSSLLSLALTSEGPFSTGSSPFAPALLGQHALAWVFLAATAARLRTSWRQKPRSPETQTSATRRPRVPALNSLAQARHRRLRRAGPIATLAWQSSWARTALPWITAGTLLAATLTFLLTLRTHPPLHAGERASLVLAVGFLLLKLLLIVHCAYFLQDTCRSGAMELILTTPLPSQTFRQGHFAALRELFTTPILLLGLAHVTTSLVARTLAGGDWPSPTFLVLTAITPPLLSTGVHALDALALAYHASTWALRYDRPAKAVARSTLLALGLPALLCGNARFLIDLIILGQRHRDLLAFRERILGWFFPDRSSRFFGAPRHG